MDVRTSTSCREWAEVDVVNSVQVKETWRRVREGGPREQAVTQRVMLTHTVKKRASVGTVLEENENEVDDHIDDDACDGNGTGKGLPALETALRRSSLISSSSNSKISALSSTAAQQLFMSPAGHSTLEMLTTLSTFPSSSAFYAVVVVTQQQQKQ